ncbi:MAG: APC family permease [Candidatus Babeliaceae bacterium]
MSQHKMGLGMATIVGMNAMIGASIFTIPAMLQTSVGPAGLITYAIVIVSVWCMAYALARVAQLYPQEGAFYVYGSAVGGHLLGSITLLSYIIGLLIAMGLLTRFTGINLHTYFPSFSPTTLGLITLWLLIALNCVGAVLSKIGQIILIILTLIPLLLISILCLSKASFASFTPFAPFGLSSIFLAIETVIFGFFGFEAIPSLFPLIQNPQKNVPRAISLSIILTGLVYIIFVGSLISALPPALFTSPDIPLAQTLLTILPHHVWLIQLIQWAIIITIMGTIHAMSWSLGTLICSAAKRITGKEINNRLVLVVMGLFISIICITFTSLNLFFSLTALFIVAAYGISISSLFISAKIKKSQVLLAICGLTAAALIFVCACAGIIGELLKKM